MTNLSIDTRDASLALAAFYAGPTASAEERAAWSRDDLEMHRQQRRDHFLRHAGPVADALQALLAQLQIIQNPFPDGEDLTAVALFNEDGSPRTLDEVRAEGMRKAAILDAHAEAHRLYNGDTILDDNTGEPTSHDDWGYAEFQRQAFVAGAAWSRGETAPAANSTPQEGPSA